MNNSMSTPMNKMELSNPLIVRLVLTERCLILHWAKIQNRTSFVNFVHKGHGIATGLK